MREESCSTSKTTQLFFVVVYDYSVTKILFGGGTGGSKTYSLLFPYIFPHAETPNIILINFSSPTEPQPTKTLTGQEKLTMETPTQLLLNYCQESLFFSWQHRACLSVGTTNSYVQYKTDTTQINITLNTN